jgi:hypothetical protein
MMLKGTHIYPPARRTIFFVEFNARVFIRMFVAFMHAEHKLRSSAERAREQSALLCARQGWNDGGVLGASFVARLKSESRRGIVLNQKLGLFVFI